MSDARDDIIDLFEKGTFPYKGNVFKTKEKESITERTKKIFEYAEDKSKGINYELFKKYFYSSLPSALVKKLYETKNKNENNELVNVIKSRLIDLKDEIEKMSEEEKKIEKPNEIVNIVEEILEFNREKQSGQGLKILTPNQMLSRLPITLAQLKQKIILKNLKMKLDNYCILCTDQKNLQNNYIKV